MPFFCREISSFIFCSLAKAKILNAIVRYGDGVEQHSTK
jgi:hypothetical protein